MEYKNENWAKKLAKYKNENWAKKLAEYKNENWAKKLAEYKNFLHLNLAVPGHLIIHYYCSCLYLWIGQVWWLNELWFKRYIQKCTISCTNTYNDVTDLVNHGMSKNTKTWISWEWNIMFMWNTKILNLCLIDTFWEDQVVAEVTFKSPSS